MTLPAISKYNNGSLQDVSSQSRKTKDFFTAVNPPIESNSNLKRCSDSTPISPGGSLENLDSTYESSIEAAHSSFNNNSNKPGNTKPEETSIQLLQLSIFKIYDCPHGYKHDHKKCPYYHYSKDRRRAGYTKFTGECKYIKEGEICPKGDSCPYAHSQAELLYFADKYKTRFCSRYPNDLKNCEFGEYCSFAHSEEEIRVDLIHHYKHDSDFYMFYYKTVWCPYNIYKHDRAYCVYAHNWQDFRRRPDLHFYEPTLCPEWRSSEILKFYEDGGCPLQLACTKSHGWKELEFHPNSYKYKPCTVKKCQEEKECPYYHHPSEKRTPPPRIIRDFFRLAPKNRIAKHFSAGSDYELQLFPQKQEHAPQTQQTGANSGKLKISKPLTLASKSLAVGNGHQSLNSNYPKLLEEKMGISPHESNREEHDQIFESKPKMYLSPPSVDHLSAVFGNGAGKNEFDQTNNLTLNFNSFHLNFGYNGSGNYQSEEYKFDAFESHCSDEENLVMKNTKSSSRRPLPVFKNLSKNYESEDELPLNQNDQARKQE